MRDVQVLRVVLFVVFIWFCLWTFVNAAEPDSVIIGKKYFLSVELAQLGAVVSGSAQDGTLLEARPFIGTGLNFSILELRRRYGLNIFTLFYTEGESVYPTLAGGFTVLSARCALGYNFGRIDGKLDKSYKERLCLVVSFNPFK